MSNSTPNKSADLMIAVGAILCIALGASVGGYLWRYFGHRATVFGVELIATYFGTGGGTGTTNAPPKFNPAVLQNGSLVLSWTGTGTLQEANEVTGSNWTDVPNATNPFTVSVLAQTRKFYRLKQ